MHLSMQTHMPVMGQPKWGCQQHTYSCRSLRSLGSTCPRPSGRNFRHHIVKPSAAAQIQTSLPMSKSKPDWAGENAFAQFVTFLISIKPLYAVMKVLAKKVIKDTAVKSGVQWDETIAELKNNPEVYRLKEEFDKVEVTYPSYYVQPFHAYTNGNLEWLAAFEVEAATYGMVLRVYKDPALSPGQAEDKVRQGIVDAVLAYQQQFGGRQIKDVLDVGCSAGVSTRWMADNAFPGATFTGLDLSPYFLAVAELRERQLPEGSRPRIKYLRALGEETGLPSASIDLLSLQYVAHECPQSAIRALIREARRLLRPGGMMFLVDNDPKSEVIQNLPPAIFTLMKSTEPWSDEYYIMDIEGTMEEEGFASPRSVLSDPRHRTIVAGVPL